MQLTPLNLVSFRLLFDFSLIEITTLQVVGDGNFAVVRVCYSRVTRKEFAVKIIDKVKVKSLTYSSPCNFTFLISRAIYVLCVRAGQI